MNLTAEKLREAADYMKGEGVTSLGAIIRLHEIFDVADPGTALANLGAILEAIADELDELDDKAARRRTHIVRLESTIAERNREMLKLRGQIPTERGRQILDMWPRYEDGECVWFGDEIACGGAACDLEDVKLVGQGADYAEAYLYASRGHDVFEVFVGEGQRVKRPVQSVLDADGVEIKVGDTVWWEGKPTEYKVATVIDGIVYLTYKACNGDNSTATTFARNLTHTRPDSWERLEEDAELNDETGVVGGNLDIVRRAKALAGIEVAE